MAPIPSARRVRRAFFAISRHRPHSAAFIAAAMIFAVRNHQNCPTCGPMGPVVGGFLKAE
jgi:hypothetical protein